MSGLVMLTNLHLLANCEAQFSRKYQLLDLL